MSDLLTALREYDEYAPPTEEWPSTSALIHAAADALAAAEERAEAAVHRSNHFKKRVHSLRADLNTHAERLLSMKRRLDDAEARDAQRLTELRTVITNDELPSEDAGWSDLLRAVGAMWKRTHDAERRLAALVEEVERACLYIVDNRQAPEVGVHGLLGWLRAALNAAKGER